MKWAYSIHQKHKAAFFTLIILTAVISVNMINNKQINQLGNSMNEFYEDRLVAESYIFRISELLFQKKLSAENCRFQDVSVFEIAQNEQLNLEMQDMFIQYELTRLTKQEAVTYNNFKQTFSELDDLGKRFYKPVPTEEKSALKNKFDLSYEKALVQLKQLSEIQLSEGRSLNASSNRIMAHNSFLTNFELLLVIIIAAFLFNLLFASKSLITRPVSNAQLN
ncbi:MAG: MCP four helix bundle domain-containing protein [Saprospiraceae bacterium]|nr:MCP four helix bundle domain-containing protein [Saprospiraceae bacterium]